MAGIVIRKPIDHALLFGRPARVPVEALVASNKPVLAQPPEGLLGLLLACIEPLRHCGRIPSFIRISTQEKQRLQLTNRVYVSEDEVPDVLRDLLAGHISLQKVGCRDDNEFAKRER